MNDRRQCQTGGVGSKVPRSIGTGGGRGVRVRKDPDSRSSLTSPVITGRSRSEPPCGPSAQPAQTPKFRVSSAGSQMTFDG